MLHTSLRPRRRRLAAPSIAVLIALAAPVALAACGSDAKPSSDSSAPGGSLAPEDIKVDDATVTAGLTKLPATAASAIAAIGTPDAKAKREAIEDEWASFEGTIRDKEPTLYIDIEDQLHLLEKHLEEGDSAAATATVTTMSGLFAQYLAKHP